MRPDYYPAPSQFARAGWNMVDLRLPHPELAWYAQTRTEVGQPLRGHLGRVLSIAYSPDRRRIISDSSDRMIRIWDTQAIPDLTERKEGLFWRNGTLSHTSICGGRVPPFRPIIVSTPTILSPCTSHFHIGEKFPLFLNPSALSWLVFLTDHQRPPFSM